MAKKKTSSARSSSRPTRKSTASSRKVAKVTTAASNGTTNHIDVAEGKRLTKSPLSAKELRDFRQLLMRKRLEILGDMTTMSRDALNSDAANLSHMPIHMADVGSDNYEQELTLGLVESERRLLTEIDEAIGRIGEGTYGVCEVTGKAIGKARLNAKPWAKHCIEAAREYERNGGR